MKNKIQVKIHGIEYTLLSSEPEEYVQKVALTVNRTMAQVTENDPHLSTAMTALLAAINLADACLKGEGNSEHLREQVTEYADEIKRLTRELDNAKEENRKINADLQKLTIDIAKKDTLISNLRHSERD